MAVPDRRWRRVAALWLACWVCLVLYGMPAAWLLPLLDDQLAADALHGSIHEGRALNARLGNPAQRVAVGDLSWRLLPLHSLRNGSVCVQFASELGAQTAAGIACLQGAASLTLQDLTLELPAAYTQQAQGLQLRGDILLHVSSLRIRSGRLELLEGRGDWRAAAVHDGTQWLQLGELGMQLALDASGTPELTLVDIAAPFRARLQFAADAAGRLRMRGEVTRTPATPQALLQVLGFLAAEREGEHYRLDLNW